MLDIATFNIDRKQQWDVDANAWTDAFSNFEPTPITVEHAGIEITAATGEHAFQALKTLDPTEREKVLAAKTPAMAKRLGKRVPLRNNWDARIAIEVMQLVVMAKIEQHQHVTEALAATGDAPIIEVTAWNDTRWGTTKTGKGANLLGQIWMSMRA